MQWPRSSSRFTVTLVAFVAPNIDAQSRAECKLGDHAGWDRKQSQEVGKLLNRDRKGRRLRSAMCKSEVGASTWQRPLADARAAIHPSFDLPN